MVERMFVERVFGVSLLVMGGYLKEWWVWGWHWCDGVLWCCYRVEREPERNFGKFCEMGWQVRKFL